MDDQLIAAAARFFGLQPDSTHYLLTEVGAVGRLAFIFPTPPRTTRPCCVPHQDGGAWRVVVCPRCFQEMIAS